ncbi:unnamed protein product [Blepharisma stoltei]|uniref:ZZ-type domain-containing protein n=1 Tax=Blepharisma stoltei TaxID=1481888 RepID=A0AAU9JA13_9CILI|nr:unnamed protein product [Blepharisma stoltei]
MSESCKADFSASSIKLERLNSVTSLYSHDKSSSFSGDELRNPPRNDRSLEADSNSSNDTKKLSQGKVSQGVSTSFEFSNSFTQTEAVEYRDKITSIEVNFDNKETQYDLPTMVDMSIIKKILTEEVKEFVLKHKVQFPISNVNNECSNCQKNIQNEIKYACSICTNWTLCEDCEDKSNHPHPMYKFKLARDLNGKKIEQERKEFVEKLKTKKSFSSWSKALEE